MFESTVMGSDVNGTITQLYFSTPMGTSGSVSVPGVKETLKFNDGGGSMLLVNAEATGLEGGNWTLCIGCLLPTCCST